MVRQAQNRRVAHTQGTGGGYTCVAACPWAAHHRRRPSQYHSAKIWHMCERLRRRRFSTPTGFRGEGPLPFGSIQPPIRENRTIECWLRIAGTSTQPSWRGSTSASASMSARPGDGSARSARAQTACVLNVGKSVFLDRPRKLARWLLAFRAGPQQPRTRVAAGGEQGGDPAISGELGRLLKGNGARDTAVGRSKSPHFASSEFRTFASSATACGSSWPCITCTLIFAYRMRAYATRYSRLSRRMAQARPSSGSHGRPLWPLA
jgi:hypothetical protein